MFLLDTILCTLVVVDMTAHHKHETKRPRRPSSVMGMHFFSPAHMMPLVECVRGEDSSPTTIAAVMGASKRLKKVGGLTSSPFIS